MKNYLDPYEMQFDKAERREMTAARIKNLRLRHNYSQKFVSQAIGINQQTYSGYENNVSEPNIEILVRLSYLYNTTIDDLTQKHILTRTEHDAVIKLNDAKRDIQEISEYIAESSDESNEELKGVLSQLDTLTSLLLTELYKHKRAENRKKGKNDKKDES